MGPNAIAQVTMKARMKSMPGYWEERGGVGRILNRAVREKNVCESSWAKGESWAGFCRETVPGRRNEAETPPREGSVIVPTS